LRGAPPAPKATPKPAEPPAGEAPKRSRELRLRLRIPLGGSVAPWLLLHVFCQSILTLNIHFFLVFFRWVQIISFSFSVFGCLGLPTLSKEWFFVFLGCSVFIEDVEDLFW